MTPQILNVGAILIMPLAALLSWGVARTDLELKQPVFDRASISLGLMASALCAWAGTQTPLYDAALFTVVAPLITAAVIIDYRTTLLPDSLTLATIWLGLLFSTIGGFVQPSEAILGAIAGYGGLRLLGEIYRLITGQIGMGQGDMKLMAALGAWGGWEVLPATLFGAATTAFTVQTLVLLAKRSAIDEPTPFGPYLGVAGLVMLLWGEWINELWLDGLI